MNTRPLSTSAHSDLLIFDGDCAFCTTWVDRLRDALPAFPEAQPSQWTDLSAYALSDDNVARYAWYVTPRRQYAGHLALSALLRRQPRFGLRFLGWLIATPPWSWLAAGGYSLVARFRHRLPGGTPACAMPRD